MIRDPALAQQAGFTEDDLDLLWQALGNMFDVDRSAARGLMAARGLRIFKHASSLGEAPARDQGKQGRSAPRASCS
jgi:CRISPR-associated protein Csd2